MAHVISVTDGTTTITFTAANGYQILAYDLVTPQEEGGVMPADVAETLEYFVSGSSTTQVQTRVGALDRVLDAARRRAQWGVGPRVYIKLQLDGEAAAWRAEILGVGAPVPQEDTLRLWPNLAPAFSLSLRRTAFWESDTLTQIPLTNGNGTNNTTGLTVNPVGGAQSYAQIAAANIAGNLPAPLQLELTNNTGGSVTYYEVLVANNAFSDPANFPQVMQAEATRVSGSGTIASDATCSGGQYVGWSFTNSSAQQYTLSQTLLQDALGYDFHLLARFRSQTLRVFVRPHIYDATGTFVLWSGGEVELPLIGPSLADLGVIPLPPGGYSTAYGALRLWLAWRAEGAVAALDTDFFAFFPADTFRRIRAPITVSNSATIVDDGIEGRAYLRTSGTELSAVQPQGKPLLVWPNATQRLYFGWSLADWTAPITQTLSVKAWYRPRRYSF